MKEYQYFYSLDGMQVYRRVTPNIRLTNTHLFNTVERGIVRVKVSWLRTQHYVPDQASNLGPLSPKSRKLIGPHGQFCFIRS